MIFTHLVFAILFVVHQCAALKGTSLQFDYMAITAYVNGTDLIFELQSTWPVGWMGIGFGDQMRFVPLVIMWPTTDGSGAVLSHRRAGIAYAEPDVVDNPPQVARVNDVATRLTASETVLSFTIDNVFGTSFPIAYAFSLENPRSDSPSATLRSHAEYDVIQLDLSQELPLGGPKDGVPTDPPGGAPSRSTSAARSTSTSRPSPRPQVVLPPLRPYQQMIIAHAVISSFAFLVLLPTGILLARWARVNWPGWFSAHWKVQAALSLPFVVVGFVLGPLSVTEKGGAHFDDPHKACGLVLLIFYIFQLVLGAFIHFYKPPPTKSAPIPRRPPQNYGHAILGLTIIAIAFYQVYSGIAWEWTQSTGRPAPGVALTNWWTAWVVIIPVLYFAGLSRLPKQLRAEARARTEALRMRQSRRSRSRSRHRHHSSDRKMEYPAQYP